MSMVNGVGQLMQSAIAGSTQERLECLAGEGRMKHLVPAVLWGLYPLFVDIWMALRILGLVKLGYPIFVVFYTKFMVMALRKAGGSESQVMQQTIAELCSEAVDLYVSDPVGVLRAPSVMIDILGEDMVYGIIGYQIFRSLRSSL